MKRLTTIALVLLHAALAACSKPPAGPPVPEDTTPPVEDGTTSPTPDTVKPLLEVTSSGISTSASYTLAGHVFDETGVTALTYSLNGAAAEDLTASATGRFTAGLTLRPGSNEITVSAGDAAGNTSSVEHAVEYQAPPGTLGVQPTVAARGQVITVNGSNLGETGTLIVGGVPAVIDSWSDDTVQATIAGGTPHGWQDVTLETPFGTDTFSGFFVGTEFTGEAVELQDFLGSLTKGTAVLLQDQIYDLSGTSETFILDNHSLYGRGKGATSLLLPVLPEPGFLFIDFGQEVTVADLTIAAPGLVFGSGSLTPADNTLSTASVRPLAGFSFPGLQEILRSAAPEPQELTLQSSRAAAPALALRSVHFAEVPGMPAVIAGGPMTDLFLSGSVTLEDVSTGFTAPDSMIFLMPTRSLTVTDSELRAGLITLGALSEALSVTDSELTATNELAFSSAAEISIRGTHARAEDGMLGVIGAEVFMGLPMGAAILIEDSLLEAASVNTGPGTIVIETELAPLTLRNNRGIHADGDLLINTKSMAGEARIILQNNTSIRAGVFAADDPGRASPGVLTIETQNYSWPDATAGSSITLLNNTMRATGEVTVHMDGESVPGRLHVSGNTLSAGDEGSRGDFYFINAGDFAFRDNVLEARGSIWVDADSDNPREAVFTGNTLTAVGDDWPGIDLDFQGGSCTVSNNAFIVRDNTGGTDARVGIDCSAPMLEDSAFHFSGNTVGLSGAGHSSFGAYFTGGFLTFTDNDITAEEGAALYLTDTDATARKNSFSLGSAGILIEGDVRSSIVFSANNVTLTDHDNDGLWLDSIATAEVTGNIFTDTGTAGPFSTAFSMAANANSMVVTATGNTFTNFTNALYLSGIHDGSYGVAADLSGNVFDFPLTGAPQAASLHSISDVITAMNNTWGTNTDAATVASYVYYSPETVALGGEILLDPITVP